jgi:hypothetical protein
MGIDEMSSMPFVSGSSTSTAHFTGFSCQSGRFLPVCQLLCMQCSAKRPTLSWCQARFFILNQAACKAGRNCKASTVATISPPTIATAIGPRDNGRDTTRQPFPWRRRLAKLRDDQRFSRFRIAADLVDVRISCSFLASLSVTCSAICSAATPADVHAPPPLHETGLPAVFRDLTCCFPLLCDLNKEASHYCCIANYLLSPGLLIILTPCMYMAI